MKKLISLFVVATLILSGVSFAFTDVVSTHWAKEAIDKMVSEGIISGYTDGTFRPSRNISKIESLILLAKIAGVNKYTEAATSFETKYASDLSKYTTSYKKQVAYLMGVGVLQTADLDNLLSTDKINSPITREEMAILITKILGKDSEVKGKSFVILPFKDASEISTNAKPYVEYVYNQEIMSGVDANNFSPLTYVTRAQAAIILNSIYSKVDFKPTVAPPTVTLGTIKGEITTIAAALYTVWVEDTAGNEDAYIFNSSTKFYLDDKSSTVSSIKEGMKVELAISNDIITKLYAETQYTIDTKSVSTTGEIVEIIDDDKIVVAIKVGSTTKYYYIESSSDLYIDGDDAEIDDFDEGDEVEFSAKNGAIIEMSIEEEVEIDIKDSLSSGTITAISKSGKMAIITLKYGSKTKSYKATSNTDMYIDDYDAEIDDFVVGDVVEIHSEDGVLEEIYIDELTIDDDIDENDGELIRILEGSKKSIISIREGSKIRNYIVNSSTDLYIDDDDADLDEFEIGCDVELYLDEGYVDEMTSDETSSSSSNNYFVGTITAVSTKYITVKSGSTSKKIYFDSNYEMMDIEDLDDWDIDDLSKGDTIAAFGYTKSSTFYATLVAIIEFN